MTKSLQNLTKKEKKKKKKLAMAPSYWQGSEIVSIIHMGHLHIPLNWYVHVSFMISTANNANFKLLIQ